MRLLTLTLSIAALVLARGQAPKKPADGCSPPPGSTAPSLPARLLEGQGTINFPITTKSAEAQRFFNQGVAQMHSFWAREAERSFLQAAKLDPEAPMPQWGIAMVSAGDWRPRFQLDSYATLFGKSGNGRPPAKSRALDAARKAVELSGVPGKATEVEKLYIAAVMARRNPRTKNPDEDFVKGLRAVLAKAPDDVEAKTYLALMLMRGFRLPDRTPKAPGTTEAVAILRELLQNAPDHAGVHHYVIHGFEGSTFAKDAWPSCRRYAELVPNIPHALHMPGHIWSQTGKWDEAVKSFSDAAVNETGYMKADSLYGSGHHGHNVHYMATAYSFAGEYDKAIAAARGLLEYKENPREAKQLDTPMSAYNQGWFGMLRALVQFRKWDAILADDILPAPPKARQKAWRHWARGLAYASKNDAVSALAEAKKMDEALGELRLAMKRKPTPELFVARKELAGHIDIARQRLTSGLKKLEAASRDERRLLYSEPPHYPRPVAEALGYAEMRRGNSQAAERAFRVALEQYPADHHAESGLRALGKPGTDAGGL
jgi:tetratricopeptide (TPR) repeat protein